MKISEKRLRKIIRETIAEAQDPNVATGFGQIIRDKAKAGIKDQIMGNIPGLGQAVDVASSARRAMADKDIASSYEGKEIAGFKRACRSFESRVREVHKRGEMVDVVEIFNELLRENGVNRYKVYDDDMSYAGEFEAFTDD